MESNKSELSSSIHKIYNSEGKNKNEWQEFLYEININKKKINNQIITRLNQSFKDKNKIELTPDFLDFIIDYGSNTLIDLISDEKFLGNFISLIKKSANSSTQLQKKVIFLIQKWALKFENKNIHPIFKNNYNYLKSLNIAFPSQNYNIDTYKKYISEEEINETMILIKKIILARNEYKNAIKNFYNAIQYENPFLDKKLDLKENVRNFPYNKILERPGQNKNIDNNIGKTSTLYISQLIRQENLDNKIDENCTPFGSIDHGVKNIDNNTVVKSNNKENKNIEFEKINAINNNVNNNEINDSCNKESVRSYDNINKEKYKNSSTNFSSNINNNSFNRNSNNLNNTVLNESKNNNDSNLLYRNINNDNNINNNIQQNNCFINNVSKINNNNNMFNNIEDFIDKSENNINKVNEMISSFTIYSSNCILHKEIMNIIKQISYCDNIINEYKDNISIVNSVEMLKMDLKQTCFRYECLITGKNIPIFKSSFTGNKATFNFNKDAIINFYQNKNNNNYNNYNYNNQNNNQNSFYMNGGKK